MAPEAGVVGHSVGIPAEAPRDMIVGGATTAGHSAAAPSAEESMHGYQLMQTIAERTDGAWSPSPGAIYPTLNQLEDEGLVQIDTSGGRKEVSLTEAGRLHVEEHQTEWPNPLATEDGPRLRELMHSLGEAVRQVGRTGTETQRQQAAKELTDVRRRIYLILAGDEG